MHSHHDDQSEPQEHHELQRSVRGGTRSAVVTQIASQLISLGVLSALYHLISPEDFGVFAVALLLVMLPRTFVTLGLNAAAIQKAEMTADELTAVFWWNLAFGGVASVITVVAVIGMIQFQPSTELLVVGVSLSGSALVAALGLTHQMLMERHLRIVALNRVRIVAQLIAGATAIAIARSRGGIWSLVVQHYVELAILTGLFWVVQRWTPSSPRKSANAHGLLRFGGYFSVSSLLFYLALNVDKLILYLLLGSTGAGRAAIGMYQQAFNLMMRPVLAVTTPVSAVMMPALSRAQEHRSLRDRLLIDFFRLTGMVLVPASVGLTLVADETMLVIGGSQWGQAGLLLAALAPAMAMQGLINICGSMLTAANRTREMCWGAACLMIVMVQGYVAGYYCGHHVNATPLGSTLGVAYGYTLVTVVVLFVPYSWYCARTAGIALPMLLRPLIPTVARSVAMGICVFLLRRLSENWNLPPVGRLLLLVGSGAAIYGVLAWREVGWLVKQLQSKPRAEPVPNPRDD